MEKGEMMEFCFKFKRKILSLDKFSLTISKPTANQIVKHNFICIWTLKLLGHLKTQFEASKC